MWAEFCILIFRWRNCRILNLIKKTNAAANEIYHTSDEGAEKNQLCLYLRITLSKLAAFITLIYFLLLQIAAFATIHRIFLLSDVAAFIGTLLRSRCEYLQRTEFPKIGCAIVRHLTPAPQACQQISTPPNQSIDLFGHRHVKNTYIHTQKKTKKKQEVQLKLPARIMMFSLCRSTSNSIFLAGRIYLYTRGEAQGLSADLVSGKSVLLYLTIWPFVIFLFGAALLVSICSLLNQVSQKKLERCDCG